MNRSKTISEKAGKAREASLQLAMLSTREKDRALKAMAGALWSGRALILKENAKDMAAGKKAGLSAALLDRLLLNEQRIRAMAAGVRAIAGLKDPVGEVMHVYKRPNGLVIRQVRVPIGVVAIIYESRPNVTSDCAALCLKSSNAVILKGGREAVHSNAAIYRVMRGALLSTRVPVDALQFVDVTDRSAVRELLQLEHLIDLVVPRGGEGLIRYVSANSSIPVVRHFKGVCHTYVSDKADLGMAGDICFNAKVQRPGVCNAMEKMLVHEKIARRFLPAMLARLEKAGVEIRGDEEVRRIVPGVKKALAKDWDEEYLALILAVRVVRDVSEAIAHINRHGSRHSDAIVTAARGEAELFLKGVDSACVYVNASTRFTDGYEFGLGAEVGISTDKIHVRGPMGLQGLTSYKYQVYGRGQVRT
jgi:glutamate-5-semialdehyde dehydrogenase